MSNLNLESYKLFRQGSLLFIPLVQSLYQLVLIVGFKTARLKPPLAVSQSSGVNGVIQGLWAAC